MKVAFQMKYGHDAAEASRRMVAQTMQNRRDQAELEASLVRAGRRSPGSTDVLVRPVASIA